jgi:hypothetical protein
MVLREAGLVEDRRDGMRIYYRVVKPEVYELVDSAVRISGMKPIPVFHTKIEHCPCPECSPSAENISVKEHTL